MFLFLLCYVKQCLIGIYFIYFPPNVNLYPLHRTYCPTVEDQYAQGADAMIKLRLGLMKLLEKKLFNLPSEHVPAVIGEVLKAEYMLIWAYHHSDDVRELAIRVRNTT